MLSRLLLNETSESLQAEARAYVKETRKSAGPWTYGLLRPVASSTVPAGYASFGQDPRSPHGTVTYPELLPQDAREHFELYLLPTQEQEGLIATDLLVTVLAVDSEGLRDVREGLFEDPKFFIRALQSKIETLARERWGLRDSQTADWLTHRLIPNQP